MSLYGVPAEFVREEGMELVDENTLKSWRVGSRLVYALLVEAHYPSHKDGVVAFSDLIDNLAKYIEDETSIEVKDTIKMFDVVVKENKPKLLAKLLNNALIPNSSYNGNIAKSALKQAIRVGSVDILDYLIEENVQIISNTSHGEHNKNKYDEIRSLIFNILQSVRIGYKRQTANNVTIANKFWKYLAESMYRLYHDEDIENENENEMKQSGNDKGMLKYTNNDNALSLMRYSKFMISNPLIVCCIYKSIHSSLSGKHYIDKLKPVLHFICEHYMNLDDSYDLEQLLRKCENDKYFDCVSLKEFKIKYGHALQQEYAPIKAKRRVELFWSEYILIKLMNDYLGIDPNKMNTVKRMDKYGGIHINPNDNQEREEMLYCVKYIVSNGAANHMDDIVLPLLNGYQKQFSKTDDDDQEMNKLFDAVRYGDNIWRLKQLKNNEIAQLFENVCNKQIVLPLQIVSLIISFVVL